ncbi:MAG: transketolase [Alphaproteobacteria bacterium]|nr:transketolase [Alphaproteobacteria bacterium]
MRAPLRLVQGEGKSTLPREKLRLLAEIEKKVLWLSSWMIHNANHVRPARDGIKVGGHQSSCASAVTLLTALYMDVLRPQDRIAVKPHASPVFHALMYLLGRQTQDKLESFRGLGGAQSYPSRTKDTDDVDFSTGSVGLGVGVTLFASLVQDYAQLHGLMGETVAPGRMVALMGDAELDEGNVFEALLEGWKHDVRNLWWVIDYNRQSLDGVVNDQLFQKIQSFFDTVGWNVVTLKYGKHLEAARHGPAGEALLQWIDECPNDLYSALTFKGGEAWREHLKKEMQGTAGLPELLDSHDDVSLHRLMTNLAGHDMETVLEAFHAAAGDDRPQCFVAYTIKGYGLPLAGHKDNHAGLMNPQQMDAFKAAMRIPDGKEWDPYAGLEAAREDLQVFLQDVPFAAQARRRHAAPRVDVPESFPLPAGDTHSTQQAFGQILNQLAQSDAAIADHVVTTSPDVTVSTNLGGWVNHRGLFSRRDRPDVFREEKVASAQKWVRSRDGQHMELGIAENNLFLLLAALGLSHSLFGARLLPVGTLYDPFINRGLDSLFYACYQDARFMSVATPSGVTLAPEGGAHQSINTPLVGMGVDKLAYFEPAFVDEMAEIMRWGFEYMQAEDGGSIYLRLSTRPLEQPKRTLTDAEKQAICAGAYWIVPPAPGAELAIVYTGAVAPEAIAAHREILEDVPGAGLLAVTSPDHLHADWLAAARRRAEGDTTARAHVETLLAPLGARAALVTVLDGHPATLSWMGSVGDYQAAALGVERFGQASDILDAYRLHGIDTEAILDAAASASLARLR